LLPVKTRQEEELMQIPWYLTALGAALVWGLHYPLIGYALKKVSLFCVVLLTSIPVVLLIPVFTETLSNDYKSFAQLILVDKFIVLSIGLTSLLATVLLYMSIENKNATLASLIEITYPVFVALFSYLLFKHIHFNASVIIGALLVFSGASIIILNNG